MTCQLRHRPRDGIVAHQTPGHAGRFSFDVHATSMDRGLMQRRHRTALRIHRELKTGEDMRRSKSASDTHLRCWRPR